MILLEYTPLYVDIDDIVIYQNDRELFNLQKDIN